MALHDHRVTLVFGILGNVVSFLVYLSPVATFYRIVKKKSTEGFQSIPYSVALFSAMLMLYYAYLKTNAFMLITINSIGCVIESIYLLFYMIYATKTSRIFTTKLLILFNVGAYALIVLSTFLLAHGSLRLNIVGWFNVVFSVCVFAAPLSIIRQVVRTKSVEFMPFSLSFFLTLCAVCWLIYGLSLPDYYVASPNLLGLGFGFAQMVLYFIYKNRKKEIVLPETQISGSRPHANGNLTQTNNEDEISSNDNLNNRLRKESNCVNNGADHVVNSSIELGGLNV